MAFVMVATILSPSYSKASEYSNYVKHSESTFVEDGKTYKVEEDLIARGDKIKTTSQNVGKYYTRYYGDFYTTSGEYITSLHLSKRGYN